MSTNVASAFDIACRITNYGGEWIERERKNEWKITRRVWRNAMDGVMLLHTIYYTSKHGFTHHGHFEWVMDWLSWSAYRENYWLLQEYRRWSGSRWRQARRWSGVINEINLLQVWFCFPLWLLFLLSFLSSFLPSFQLRLFWWMFLRLAISIHKCMSSFIFVSFSFHWDSHVKISLMSMALLPQNHHRIEKVIKVDGERDELCNCSMTRTHTIGVRGESELRREKNK
jgi:hypothetical protein